MYSAREVEAMTKGHVAVAFILGAVAGYVVAKKM
jgi:hypothetical protein